MKPVLGIVGLGLMGGSLALAARQSGFCDQIYAMDANAQQLAWALEQGIIDESVDNLASMLQVDILVLATPMGVLPSLLGQIAALGLPETLCLTDLGSVKSCLVQAAVQCFGQMPANFIPGHPIAGSEKSGVQASRADLFCQRKVVLTPDADTCPQALNQLQQLWQSVGALTCVMSPEEHDRVYAATSHLPHVLAFTFVNLLSELVGAQHLRHSVAGGFRDFSRIAASDPAVWKDICLANAPALLASIDAFQLELLALRQQISEQQSAAIEHYFERARQARLDSEQHWRAG